ncbi:sigma-70 family RNA polymerase sigma factor [Paucisalibacillus globulus]|uniref:sigma-70 family RNA polymerase sigma factor n=1 Tax=Paucisalibacillus globulus TaxID=351095 RepID=UPI000420F799|nr:sigma-70 family RNA polymerase sigma factor [Paucisalibacillus globulus]
MSIFKSDSKNINEQTFERLIVQEQKKLYRIAYAYVKNEQTALDIVQDTVIKAYKSFHKLKDMNLFSTWITRILINTSLDYLKRSIDVIPLEVEWFNSGFNEENQSIMTMDIASVFEKLRPNQKTILLLRFYYGYSIPEIAEIINKPEGTVKSQLHRTLQVLKKKLANGGDVYGEAST